jgi:zinc transport system permease protein
MTGFVDALQHHAFLRNALLAGALASIASGVIGSYVVVRRMTAIAGGVAHSVLGGIGAALYLESARGWSFLHPLHGAVVAAVVAGLIIGFMGLRGRERVDTVIGVVWAVGMAAGVLFLSRTPGYGQNLVSYLFGNILMVTREHIWLIAALDAIVLAAAVRFRSGLFAVSFDEEFAAVRGLNVALHHMLLVLLTALTVVLLVTVVGIVMSIALLTIPPAIAGQYTRRLSSMMLAAGVLCVLLTTGGLAASYVLDLPAGAVIIVLAGAAYLVLVPASRALKRRRPRASEA